MNPRRLIMRIDSMRLALQLSEVNLPRPVVYASPVIYAMCLPAKDFENAGGRVVGLCVEAPACITFHCTLFVRTTLR